MLLVDFGKMNKQVGFCIFRTIILKWLFIRFPLKDWVCQDVREKQELPEAVTTSSFLPLTVD